MDLVRKKLEITCFEQLTEVLQGWETGLDTLVGSEPTKSNRMGFTIDRLHTPKREPAIEFA